MTFKTKSRIKQQKPFQVVVKNDPAPIGSRKQLLDKLAKTKDLLERNQLLKLASYPHRLKKEDER